MDSLANYDSDGENSNSSIDIKMPNEEKYNSRDRCPTDVNYDPIQMDMSEDSNNNNSTGESSSDGTRSPSASHQSSTTSKSESTRTHTSPSDQRRSEHESNTSNRHGESKRTDKNDRSQSGDDKCGRLSSDGRRQRDSNGKDTRRSRDDERKLRDDDRRRDKNSSSSNRDERKEDRDKKDRHHHHHHHHHHRDEKRERHRDRDRRHSRTDRTKDRHREERSSSHLKEKDRARSRSRSKERAPLPFRPMSYREEKSRNKLAQLEKLGIELKAPEGTTTTPVMLLGEQNYYNPLTTATQGKYAEQVQKRKLLWANKSKQADTKVTTAVVESTANSWIGTTFTHDQDGKMTAKFKRLMGIKGDIPTAPLPGQKPDILKKQEEMFSNMEQQYEVARATTHTQRGVGLGYASSGYQFSR